MADGKLQVQTGASGCCEPPDGCGIFDSGGSWIDVVGTWGSGTYSGIPYVESTGSNEITKWSHAATAGDRYLWDGWVMIENEADVAVFYFGYNVATDAYEGKVEVTAGNSTDGAGGNYKLYVGGVLKTNIDSAVVANALHGFGVCIGATHRLRCDGAAFSMWDSVNCVGVTDGAAGSIANNIAFYGWAQYATITPHRGFAVGSAGNTGFVRWFNTFWYKVSPITDYPPGGGTVISPPGYDCINCEDLCGYCLDATKKTNCTATFDTPDAIVNAPVNMPEQFHNQTFELETRPHELGSNGCVWNIAGWTDDTYYDDGMGGTIGIPTGFNIGALITCCDEEYYLVLGISWIHFFAGGCDNYYYHLPSFDGNCDLGEIVLDSGSAYDAVDAFCPAGCGGATATNSPSGQFILGGNTITLNFHN